MSLARRQALMQCAEAHDVLVVAPEALIHKMVQAKQAADLHTSTFDQRVGFEVLQTSLLSEHLPRVSELYRARCEVMLNTVSS